MRDQVHICNDAEALAVHSKNWLLRLIDAHARESELPFILALSGGSTPKRLYELLAELSPANVDWTKVVLMWGDERNVPADSDESNYAMVKTALLDHIAIPPENVLAVPDPGGPAETAAQQYEELLREKLPQSRQRRFPKVDCVLLGIGEDVHTASLFPKTSAISEKSRVFVANEVPQLGCWRMTVTVPMINAARNVAFFLSGEKKQEPLATLWHAPTDPDQYPAQAIRPAAGQLWYLLDKAAAGSVPLPESVMVQII